MAGSRRQKFEEIDVERINVVGPDGRVQLVISNRDRIPDPVVGGRTVKRQGFPVPGLVFYNAQGDECGGLIFGTSGENGRYEAFSGLLFDQFRQDQIVGIVYFDENGARRYGLDVWERPSRPLDVDAVQALLPQYEAVQRMPEGAEKAQAAEALEQAGEAAGLASAHRIFVGRSADGAAQVTLSDSKGRPRIRLWVDKDDVPRLEFLDEDGEVIHRLPPEEDRKS